MTNAIVKVDPILMPQTLAAVMELSEVLAKSGILPSYLNTPSKVATVILAGREFGLSAIQSTKLIFVDTKGRWGMMTALIGARIFHLGHSYEVKELTVEKCTIEFTRKGHAPVSYTVTIKEAHEGKWDSDWDNSKSEWKTKATWRSYPRDMLFNRCLAMGARKFMPDICAGFYTPDELGVSTAVTDEGEEMVDGECRPVPEPVGGDEPSPKTEPEPKSEPQEASDLTTRGARLTALQDVLKRLAGFDPQEHGPYWARNHVAKHYNKKANSDLTDLEINEFYEEALGILAGVQEQLAKEAGNVA